MAKYTTTKTTWNSLLCQFDTVTTNVDNINITHGLAEVYGSLSMRSIRTGRGLSAIIESHLRCRPGEEQRYPVVHPEFLYSRYMRGEFYARDTKLMLRALYAFSSIHYKTMEGANHACV